jgi:hypothetical protein
MGGGESETFELSGKIENETPAQREQRKHEAIVGLYNEILPELARAKKLTDSVARSLRGRIREEPARKELDWWRRYFESVREYPVLMGRAVNIDWQSCLEWLVGKKNMAKVLEDFYPKGSGGGGRTDTGAANQEKYAKNGGEIDAKALLRGEASPRH